MMKKLFSDFRFRSCFGPTVSPAAPPPLEESAAAQLPRFRRSKSVSGSHWRPKLTVISEDGVVSAPEMKDETVVRYEKRSSRKSGSMARNRSLGHRDESRKDYMAMSILTFTAAPFML